MIIKRISKLLPVLLIPLFLTSCVGEEPNDVAYVTAVGVDKKDNEYLYTVQFANPTKISGGASEEGGGGGKIVENLSVCANSPYAGFNNANAVLSKDLSLAHAKLIVVSEEVAKEGLYGFIDIISRGYEIRPDIYIAVAEDSRKYIEEVKPVIELNPAKYYQLTYEKNDFGGVAKNSALEFYFSNITGMRDCALPLAGTAQIENPPSDENSSQTESESENKSFNDAQPINSDFENNSKNYFAGQAGVKVSNKSETIGMAVFKGDKFIDKLGSIDTELYNILFGRLGENYIDFYSGEPDMPITVRVAQKSSPKYKLDKENKTVNIKIKLDAELMSLPKKYEDKNSLISVEKAISNMLSEAAEEFANRMYGNDVDILGIRGKLKTKFLTWQSYNDYCRNYNNADWKFNVESDISIVGTGIIKYR